VIEIAVIGAGHWGPNLVRTLHDHKASAVRWIVERDEPRRRLLAETYADIRIAASADDCLSDPEVDAVVVATPTSTHHALAKAALLAGKHVLVEKPITTSVREGEELCELAERGRLTLMVGHVFLFNRAVQRAKRYIDEGELGHLYYLSMVRTNLGPIRIDVSAAWDLASHDVSIANYWLGAKPLRVSATGGAWLNPGIHDAVFATLVYPENVLANLHTSWLHPRKTRDIAAIGDRRMLTFDDMNATEPLRLYDRQVTDDLTTARIIDTLHSFRSSIRDGDVLIPRVSTGEPLRNECAEFLSCLSEGRAPLAGGAFAVDVVRVLEALDRSLRSGGREEPV
jgi:predicted dehydrogenase